MFIFCILIPSTAIDILNKKVFPDSFWMAILPLVGAVGVRAIVARKAFSRTC